VSAEMPGHREVMPIDRRGLMTAAKRLARAAGALYLLVVVLAGLAQLGVRAGVGVPGDAPATAGNIAANPTMIRVSLATDIATAGIFVLAGVTLYLLFRHIDRHATGALAVFAVVGAGLIVVNLLFHHAAQLVAPDPSHNALDAPNSGGLVSLLLDMHDHGYTITGLAFGLCLLPLGYLAYQSSLFPRVVGTVLVASLIVSALIGGLWPDLPTVAHRIIAPPPVADFWMILYLVVKGGTPAPPWWRRVRVPRLYQLARLPRRSERTV
jgi:Domain of unknown function (DUF4386)